MWRFKSSLAHQFREKIQIFARMGDFLVQISQFLPQAKATFRPLSESGFWAFGVWGLGEGFVMLYNERAKQFNRKSLYFWLEKPSWNYLVFPNCFAPRRLFELKGGQKWKNIFCMLVNLPIRKISKY
jgi:hypothetical protein